MLAVVVAVVLRVLTRPDPPEHRVPIAAGASYRLSLTRFSQGEGLVCPPFRLDVYYDTQPDLRRQVLLAEQSDDVVIAQTPSVIYVFYNELVLDGFGGWIADTRDAKPLLCDINVPACSNELKRLANSGARMQRVCERARR